MARFQLTRVDHSAYPPAVKKQCLLNKFGLIETCFSGIHCFLPKVGRFTRVANCDAFASCLLQRNRMEGY
jgi:hypothetical protein